MRLKTALFAILVASVQSVSHAGAEDDLRKADADLNAAYRQVIQKLAGPQRESLREAQRAWITYRDSACSFEAMLKSGEREDWIAEQTRPAVDVRCVQRLTLERLAQLRRYADSVSPIVRGPAAPGPVESGCRLESLPAEFTVQAVGIYEGDGETDIQLDAAGHETKTADVIVNLPKTNVVLVLMASDPVVWRVKRTRDTRVVAVIVGGYRAQAVLGIERTVPLLMSTHEGRKDCGGKYFYAYKAGPKLLKANTTVEQLTGREIDHLWSSYEAGRIVVGELPARDVPLLSSDDYQPEDFTDLPRFPSGVKGLQRLVELGLMRRATPQDLDAWVEKASEKYRRFDKGLTVQRPFAPQGIYVVLAKTTFPAGLFGGHSAAFIIPPGVPLPDGSPGHSTVYYLEDGVCRGPSCPRD